MHNWMTVAMSVVQTIAMITISTPIFLVAVVPLGLIYYFVQVKVIAQNLVFENISGDVLYNFHIPVHSNFVYVFNSLTTTFKGKL